MNIPKFRAYDKVSGEVFEVVSIDFERDYVVLKSKYGAFCACLDEAEIMQSTGVKDKNEREIFEGDIVEVDDYGKIIIADVKHGEYDYSADDEYECHRYGWYINHVWNGYVRNTGYCLNVYKSHCEVIGNIYENPELLEGVKQ